MSTSLSNDDISPTTPERRTWRWWHFVALWIGMVIAVPAYLLPAGFIDQGMSPGQAVTVVLLGNLIVLIPLLLIGHAGAKYGIPFPVLARASFGTIGARLPAVARALVACVWYGVQTWIGGMVLLTLLGAIFERDLAGAPIPGLGIGAGQLTAYAAFWLVQLVFVEKGINAVRKFETWTAPLKILICIALVWWALDRAGGLGPIVAQKSAFAPGGAKEGQFWVVFWPIFTAMSGFWGALALNIPDFTRFARTQRDQIIGQAVGLPLPMALLALMSVIVTSATVIIFGKAIWDPVALSGQMGGIAVMIGLLIITVDTISVNIAANLVGPSYDFASLWPEKISYRVGGYITAGLSTVFMPWKLLADSNGYIFVWLTGYGALLGPIAGIMIADYWIVRRARLEVGGLYDARSKFRYVGGWNPAALIAFAVPVLLNVPGFLHAASPAFAGVGAFWQELYTYAWFVGIIGGFVIYPLLMRSASARSS